MNTEELQTSMKTHTHTHTVQFKLIIIQVHANHAVSQVLGVAYHFSSILLSLVIVPLCLVMLPSHTMLYYLCYCHLNYPLYDDIVNEHSLNGLQHPRTSLHGGLRFCFSQSVVS